MGCTSSKINPESDIRLLREKSTIRGDLTAKYEAHQKREQKMKDRQVKVANAAEELSGRVLEEKERLSIASWSRSLATSRETSRAGSPTVTTNSRKHVHFKTGESTTRSVIESDSGIHSGKLPKSSLTRAGFRQPPNGMVTGVHDYEHVKSISSAASESTKATDVSSVDNDDSAYSANDTPNGQSFGPQDSHVTHGQPMKPGQAGLAPSVMVTIEERASSRGSNKSEMDGKRG